MSSDRQSRKRKRISWEKDDKICKFHYFEKIPDERCNVSRQVNVEQSADTSTSAVGSTGFTPSANNKSPNAAGGGKMSNACVDPAKRPNAKTEANVCVEYPPWRALILIDFTPELPAPGWNSLERTAQAERETYVLGAIDLPGQTSTLDEPDPKTPALNGSTGPNSDPNTKDTSVKIIPTESADGTVRDYSSLFEGLLVNGMKLQSDPTEPQQPQPQLQQSQPQLIPLQQQQQHQQSQLLPNPFQQQLVHATQNPLTLQDMGAQFQQQAQMQIQFPFQQQQLQSPPQPFQQPIMPIVGQQQQQQQQQQHQQQLQQAPVQTQPPANLFVDQQSGLTGPVMPWLSYPFNQVNENSHAHLFRRPAT